MGSFWRKPRESSAFSGPRIPPVKSWERGVRGTAEGAGGRLCNKVGPSRGSGEAGVRLMRASQVHAGGGVPAAVHWPERQVAARCKDIGPTVFPWTRRAQAEERSSPAAP